MLALFLLLVIVAIVLGLVGVVGKGLLYLLIIGIVVFLGALLLEKRGAARALDRCRVLADEINRALHTNKVRQLVNKPSLLAEFQVAIERAASVLGRIA